jgi:hypothetical protein
LSFTARLRVTYRSLEATTSSNEDVCHQGMRTVCTMPQPRCLITREHPGIDLTLNAESPSRKPSPAPCAFLQLSGFGSLRYLCSERFDRAYSRAHIAV